MTRMLVLGANGMLGHKLLQRAAARLEVVGTARRENLAAAKVAEEAGGHLAVPVDATPDAIGRVIRQFNPDVVVNCIGVVKQREASHDATESIRLNSLFPHQISELCDDAGAWFVHISTDCVFSGRKGDYSESDVADAPDLYGRSKLLGEVVGGNALTLRTSMIGRELSGFRSLIEWFIRQPSHLTIRGFTQAIFSGLTTAALADEIVRLIDTRSPIRGLYHISANPISKYDLLHLVNDEMNLGRRIEADSDFHCDRSLNSDRYRAATGFTPLEWPRMIHEMAGDPTSYEALTT